MIVFGPLARALGAGFDALTRPTARLNERFEAHWLNRTQLLRAHYDRQQALAAKPLPVVDSPIDLSLRDGAREAA